MDAIADKYICPDEGTYDFALMFHRAAVVVAQLNVKLEPSLS